MRKTIARLLVPIAVLLSAVVSPAQPASRLPLPVPGIRLGDDEWNEVRDLVRVSGSQLGTGGNGSNEPAQGASVSVLIENADKLRQFYTKFPLHSEAKEAKCEEVLLLTEAWLAGDETQKDRRERLVGEVRGDRSIPVSRRAEVAGLAGNIAVGKQLDLSRDARLAEYEKVARAMVAEFPELPELYESLLHIAADNSPERAVALVREIADGAAPESVKTEANRLLDRYALRGRSLTELVGPELERIGLPPGQWESGMVLYTWATFSPESIAIARQLAQCVPAQCPVLGININDDPATMEALARQEKLPGTQVEAGQGRFICRALLLDVPGQVYFCDRQGIIRSVSAQSDLSAMAEEVFGP